MGYKCTFTLPTFFHFRGSVVNRIYLEVILCSLYAALIAYLTHKKILNINPDSVPDNAFNVLGVATGMLLVFRTNTSYDRFWEGRKLWSDLTVHIRTLTRTFWIMVDDKQDSKLIIEKISAINLSIAFAYATKHYLREEYSYDEADLIAIAGHLPQFFTPTAVQQTLARQEKILTNATPLFGPSEYHRHKLPTLANYTQKRKSSTPYGIAEKKVGSNIPLEITYLLSSYVKSCKDRGLIDSPTSRVIDTSITAITNCLTCFETLRRTPIPMAYLVHLNHVTWIILLFLPFHWVQKLQWCTVPAIAIVSFSMLGILGIGREIEDPFGYEYNDLNLDDYCRILHKEAIVITAQPIPPLEEWMFSEENHPIASYPELNAAELVQFPPDEIGKILFAARKFKFI